MNERSIAVVLAALSVLAPKGARAQTPDPDLAPVAPAQNTIRSLAEVLSRVGGGSADVLIARQEIERSRGLWRQALAQALPTINLTGSLQVGGSSGGNEAALGMAGNSATATGSVSLAQPLLAPRAWYGIGTAQRSIEAAQYAAADKERSAIANAVDAVVAVAVAERAAAVSRSGLASALEVLELTHKKERTGSATRLDIVRAEQDVGNARAAIVTANEAVRKAREALGLALGSADAHGIDTALSLEGLAPALRGTCTVGPIERRPDVLAAQANLEVAERGVTSAKLAYAPTATLSATAQAATGTLDASRTQSWSIQALLTVPIWDGGARYGSIRSARASAEEQRIQLDATKRNALVQDIQARRAIDVAGDARRVSAKNRDLAVEAARLTQAAFSSGSGTSFDVIDAAKRRRDAELDLVQKEYELARARLDAVLVQSTCSLPGK
jgi:outer membrane protein TolC